MQRQAFHALLATAALAGLIALAPVEASSQTTGRVVIGKVTDAFGEPLPGATIMVQGTTSGTITD